MTLRERVVSTPLDDTVPAWLCWKGLRGNHLSPGFPNVCHMKVCSGQGVPFWPTTDCTYWISRSLSTGCARSENHRPFPVPSLACPLGLLLAFMGRSNQNIGAITQMFYIYCVKLKNITSVCIKKPMGCWTFSTITLMKTLNQNMLNSSLYCVVKYRRPTNKLYPGNVLYATGKTTISLYHFGDFWFQVRWNSTSRRDFVFHITNPDRGWLIPQPNDITQSPGCCPSLRLLCPPQLWACSSRGHKMVATTLGNTTSHQKQKRDYLFPLV